MHAAAVSVCVFVSSHIISKLKTVADQDCDINLFSECEVFERIL